MLISQTAEYALRAMVLLASRPGSPLTTQQISEAARIPPGYLAKVMQALGRGALVHATRGLHGGFLLARAPEEISIYEVLHAVDPLKRIRACPLGIESHVKLCPLHRRLDEAMATAEQSFRETLLSELVEQGGAPAPLCGCASHDL